MYWILGLSAWLRMGRECLMLDLAAVGSMCGEMLIVNEYGYTFGHVLIRFLCLVFISC